MNKKGFTLVELLAVIAILAILVIIALPNVLKLYNDARKNSFATEVKTLYNSVPSKYFTSNLNSNKLSYISSKNDTKLDLSGEDLEYCINLNNDGSVKSIAVLSDSYYVEYSGDITKLSSSDVKESNGRMKIICSKLVSKVVERPEAKECTSNVSLKSGATYNDGVYKYTYNVSSDGDGWSVVLADKNSTDPVKETPCSVIDNMKVNSTYNMFYGSKASSIDISNLDTSNVTKMDWMFYGSEATEIIGLENMDTSSVTSMRYMFYESKAKKLNLENFDTSKVDDMLGMFYGSEAETLDLSSFDTSNVTDMYQLFSKTKAKTIDVSHFDTSNVTNMANMFFKSEATEIIGLNYFDTSNVTRMDRMFESSSIVNADLTKFNTSKVTNMSGMFEESSFEVLDLSSFDTSNTTNVSRMFLSSKATTGYARTQSDADKLNNSSSKPSKLTFVVK